MRAVASGIEERISASRGSPGGSSLHFLSQTNQNPNTQYTLLCAEFNNFFADYSIVHPTNI